LPARIISIQVPRSHRLRYIVYRLEQAGATLLALPGGPYPASPRDSLRSLLPLIRSAADTSREIRPRTPTAWQITLMDEALGWLSLIPQERLLLRQVVGARMLVSPLTGKHRFPWRRIAARLGTDHKQVQRWHAEGIRLIVAALDHSEEAQAA
jgi:hypothetical protein